MKKSVPFVLTLALLMTIVSGCGSGGNSSSAESAPESSSLENVDGSSEAGGGSTAGSVPGSSGSESIVGSSEAAGSSAASITLGNSSAKSSAGSSKPGSSTAASSATKVTANGAPKVYMTTDISSKGLMAVYNALGRKATGKTAVKISTGEAGDTYYLHPDLIKDLVHSVNGTIVECNTAYGGQRANTAMHMQVAKDHGFTTIANVDIMDADGDISLPVKGGTHLKEDLVGSHLKNYDFVIDLAHFKGHPMAGLGGVIKNMSIGIASGIQANGGSGKALIHSAGASTSQILFNTPQNDWLEAMAEAAKAVADYEGNHIVYIDVMNNLSVDCDCVSNPAAPTMKDIGILASLDPVALDKACVDLVNAAPDGHDLQQRMKDRNGIHTLDWAQKIGLGSETYQLVKING